MYLGNSSFGGAYIGFHWLSTVALISGTVAVRFRTEFTLPGVVRVTSWCGRVGSGSSGG